MTLAVLVASAAEDRQEQEKYVEDVEEDRHGEKRRRPPIPALCAKALARFGGRYQTRQHEHAGRREWRSTSAGSRSGRGVVERIRPARLRSSETSPTCF